jgi:uncharacterized membrane protein
MDPLADLRLATFVFVAAHFVTSTPLRAALVRAVGEKTYLGLYSLVSLVTLLWMCYAYAKAPYQPLWVGPHILPVLAVPFAFILIACGYLTGNPGMVMQHALLKQAEPARGILRVTRHPIMWGFMLWSAAHLAARGDMASLLFFGGFFLLAAGGTVLLDARKAYSLGEDWKRFAAATSNIPFAAIIAGRNRLNLAEIGWKKPALGLALFAAFFALHPWLFGARPY